jgi:2-polyprenyl-6-methoxyphenol hydroxylase-like FAD-dependent oxidoreductase
MKNKESPRKAIVVGGSLGGLFTAVLLHRAGWRVSVFERSAAGLAGKGAGLVAQPDVERILAEIGREDVLDSGVLAHQRIFLDRNGDILQTVLTAQSQISWDLLFEAFRSELPEDSYRRGASVSSAADDSEAATITLADGTTETADLVIGADGIGSRIREIVCPKSLPSYAGYVAFRGLSPETQLPPADADTLRDRFTFYNAHRTQMLGYLVAGPNGSIEPDSRRYNWVWYRVMTETALASVLTSDSGEQRQYSVPAGLLSQVAHQELIDSADRELPPVCARLVKLEPHPFVQAIFDYEAPSMVKGRIALLGDAAFIVRPTRRWASQKRLGTQCSCVIAWRDSGQSNKLLMRMALPAMSWDTRSHNMVDDWEPLSSSPMKSSRLTN